MFGGRIARGLLDAGQPVRALVRDREKAKDLEAAGAELAVPDMDQPESLGPALDGIDRVFLCSAPQATNNVGLIAADDAAAAGIALLSGDPEPGRDYRARKRGDADLVTDTVEELTGRKPMSVDE
jgi:NAD(P)H-binding